MQNKVATKQYTSVQVSTIDRGRLLLMMYDGGINFLKHAKSGLEEKDIVKFSRFLSKGQAIVGELLNTLDFEKGGNIARELERLYDFMLFYLTEANLQKDANKVGRVIRLLETIAEAYRQIICGDQGALERATEAAQAQIKAETKSADEDTRRLSISL